MTTRRAFALGTVVGVLVQPVAFFSVILVDRLTRKEPR